MARIQLLPLTADDITDEFVSWHRAGHTAFYSSSGRTFTKESLLTELREGEAAGNKFQYGIHHLEDKKLIGVIKIGPVSSRHLTADMATLIGDEDYLGRGLASEAIRVANGLAFEKHGVRKLYSGMFRENAGSVKAYVNGGWVIEGVRKDQYLHDGQPQDRILVACFNPKLYQGDYYQNGAYSFEEVYR